MAKIQLEGLEQRYQYYKEIIQELTLMDDTFMRNVLKEKACVEYILQIIMEKKIHIIEHVLQRDYKNLSTLILKSKIIQNSVYFLVKLYFS